MADVIANSFIYNNPTKIFFGTGKLDILHTEPLPGKKALLLTSAGNSHFKNGAFAKTAEELEKSGIDHVHLGNVRENPLKEDCEEAGRFARENHCDMIVALGGGAVLDSAVPAAIMATNKGDLWDYVDGGTGKGKIAENKPLPIVTIATTSGTGSEINECAVISRVDTREKIGMSDRRCKPVLAVIDPLYMCSIPPIYTAFQGLDAFFHHAEALISTRCNIMSEMIALKSISELAEYLPRAVSNGNDIVAREHVAFAATMGGMTMQLTRITAQHAMEHALSAFHRNIRHGEGLIMIAEEFARFFIDRHAADETFIKMARVMGYPNTHDPYDYLNALCDLEKKCGVFDLKMRDCGVTEDELPAMAKSARILQGGGYSVCPCELTDENVIEIYAKSLAK